MNRTHSLLPLLVYDSETERSYTLYSEDAFLAFATMRIVEEGALQLELRFLTHHQLRQYGRSVLEFMLQNTPWRFQKIVCKTEYPSGMQTALLSSVSYPSHSLENDCAYICRDLGFV